MAEPSKGPNLVHRSPAVAVGPLSLVVEANHAGVAARFNALLSGFGPPRHTTEPTILSLTLQPPASTKLGELAISATLDGMLLCRRRPMIVVEERITRRLNRMVLDLEPDRLHLHAGAVTKNGDTVLVIGTSMAGKSTLVAKLVSSGWDYLSDEQVGVRADGALWAFPRPITLRRNSWAFFDQLDLPHSEPSYDRVEVPPGDLGSVYQGVPVLPTMVVSPDVSSGRTMVAPLTVAETMALMVTDSLDLERSGDRGIDAIVAVCAQAPGYRIGGRDLDETCSAIEALCIEASAPGAVLEEVRIQADERTGRTPGSVGWLFADNSAALYEPEVGVLARIGREGFSAWKQLGEVSAQPAQLQPFVDQLRAAGFVSATGR